MFLLKSTTVKYRHFISLVKKTNVSATSSRGLSKLSVNNGIAVYELDRPPVNSLNLDLNKDIVNVLKQAEENKWKGLIISSASPKIFSAGIDFAELHKPDPKRLATVWHSMQEIAIKSLTCNLITTVAINGHTSAGGCLLSMLTDYRVAVEGDYTIGLNDTSVGIVPPVWVAKMMLHTMPTRKAEQAIVASTLFSPKEAIEAGLVDELASDKADAVEKCKKFINSMDHISPKVISKTRQVAKEAPLSWLIENRQKDCEEFVRKIIAPESQQIMDDYLKTLKKIKKTK